MAQAGNWGLGGLARLSAPWWALYSSACRCRNSICGRRCRSRSVRLSVLLFIASTKRVWKRARNCAKRNNLLLALTAVRLRTDCAKIALGPGTELQLVILCEIVQARVHPATSGRPAADAAARLRRPGAPLLRAGSRRYPAAAVSADHTGRRARPAGVYGARRRMPRAHIGTCAPDCAPKCNARRRRRRGA